MGVASGTEKWSHCSALNCILFRGLQGAIALAAKQKSTKKTNKKKPTQPFSLSKENTFPVSLMAQSLVLGHTYKKLSPFWKFWSFLVSERWDIQVTIIDKPLTNEYTGSQPCLLALISANMTLTLLCRHYFLSQFRNFKGLWCIHCIHTSPSLH